MLYVWLVIATTIHLNKLSMARTARRLKWHEKKQAGEEVMAANPFARPFLRSAGAPPDQATIEAILREMLRRRTDDPTSESHPRDNPESRGSRKVVSDEQ
jgi:hypothetical protein